MQYFSCHLMLLAVAAVSNFLERHIFCIRGNNLQLVRGEISGSTFNSAFCHCVICAPLMTDGFLCSHTPRGWTYSEADWASSDEQFPSSGSINSDIRIRLLLSLLSLVSEIGLFTITLHGKNTLEPQTISRCTLLCSLLHFHTVVVFVSLFKGRVKVCDI